MFEPITASPVTPMSAVPVVWFASSRWLLMVDSLVDGPGRPDPADGTRGKGIHPAAPEYLLTGQTCTRCRHSVFRQVFLGYDVGHVVSLITGPRVPGRVGRGKRSHTPTPDGRAPRPPVGIHMGESPTHDQLDADRTPGGQAGVRRDGVGTRRLPAGISEVLLDRRPGGALATSMGPARAGRRGRPRGAHVPGLLHGVRRHPLRHLPGRGRVRPRGAGQGRGELR